MAYGHQIRQQYHELRSLLELHLLQSHTLGERLFVDSFCYEFFLDEARKGKGKKLSNTPPSSPVAAPASPPVPMAAPIKKNSDPKSSSPEPASKKQEQPSPTAVVAVEKEKKSPPTNTSARLYKSFHIEPMPEQGIESFAETKELVRQLFPSFPLQEPADDAQAVAIKEQWKQSSTKTVVIVAAQEPVPHYTFLEAVAKGIRERLNAEAFLVDVQNLPALEGVILVLVTRQSKEMMPPINTPVVMLEPIERYLREPSLKRQLWDEVRNRFSNSSSP